MSLPNASTAIGLVFLFIIPRALGLGVWSLALTILQGTTHTLLFRDIKGKAKSLPFVGAAIIGAALSMAGMVPLAGFPVQYSLWQGIGEASTTMGFWFGIGALGLLVGALRTTAVLVMSPPGDHWHSLEGWAERILLGLGIVGLILFGLFPQWSQVILASLPAVFERLGK
jgi:formate hydrogenlyase subunit 3/multisubunit Na+/H+ antiporter MnhD subunit